MLIVGRENEHPEDTHVHTIDMWFSSRRERWIVERLAADGRVIGAAHVCASEQNAAACLEEWLRAHFETHLVTPREHRVARKAVTRKVAARRHAA